MISIENCFYFGEVVRKHGVEGAVIVALDVDHPQHYLNLDSALLYLNDALVPFFIAQLSLQNGAALIQFENVGDTEAAELLLGCEVYLPLEKLPALNDNEFYYHEVIGFMVTDKSFGEVGTIEQIFDMPQQAVAQVFHGEKEVLIPLKKDLVERIDREGKNLFMILPDGLVEIYL